MNDATFVAFMSDLWGGDPNADLWEIAMADDDPVFSDPDPRMEARCERSSDAAYSDLLMSPGDLPDRDVIRADHPFPIEIDSDEEASW